MRLPSLTLLVVVSLFQTAKAVGDPYAAWAEKHFGAASLASSAQEFSCWGGHADPDGDGLDNMLEYALDTDPLAFSLPPTPTEAPIPQLTGEQPAFLVTATIRTDDPDLVVFPQISTDNATWLPFATQRSEVAFVDSFYVMKVEELTPRQGFKQVTWAVRPDLVGIDPHYLRLTAIREASPVIAPDTEPKAVARATLAPVRRAVAALASTPAIPGLVFTSQTSAAVGADLLSNTVVLRGLKGRVLVTAPAGVTLIVNGIDRGQSYLVGNGDTLALKTKAPGIADQSLDRRIQVGSGSVLWRVGARRAAPLTPPSGDVAGYTPVRAGVGQNGEANISIPITVSPGVGGMEPKLSINYSSQGGNGPLGLGFSMSGLSAISRTGATVAQDGFKGGVAFDANDRFALDGQRLIAISGTDGGDGTEYRLEFDPTSRIRSYGVEGGGP